MTDIHKLINIHSGARHKCTYNATLAPTGDYVNKVIRSSRPPPTNH